MDIIHGENSPLVRVSEVECARNMDNLKNNMTKVFDYALGKISTINEMCHEKTCLQGLRPSQTQTGLYNNRRWLEA